MEYDFPKLSETDMEILKKDIRNKLQADKKKNRIIVFSIVLMIVLVVIYLA